MLGNKAMHDKHKKRQNEQQKDDEMGGNVKLNGQKH